MHTGMNFDEVCNIIQMPNDKYLRSIPCFPQMCEALSQVSLRFVFTLKSCTLTLDSNQDY